MVKHEIAIFNDEALDGWGEVFLEFSFVGSLISFVIGSGFWIATGQALIGIFFIGFIPTLVALFFTLANAHVSHSMSAPQKRLYGQVRTIKKTMGQEAPKFPVDAILDMSDDDAQSLTKSLIGLQNTFVRNQEAIKARDHRVLEIKRIVEDKTLYLKQHTEELKKMEIEE